MARIASYELAYKMQQHAPEAVELHEGEPRNPGDVRHRGADQVPHRGLRPQVPAGPPARRAGRPVRADLLRRGAQRRQLGRPHRHGRQPRQARRQHRQADRGVAEGLEAERACSTRRSSSGPASSAGSRPPSTRPAPVATTTPTGSRAGSRAAACKPGVSVGATDELGGSAVVDRCHVKNIHATVLHQMGLDPNKLTLLLRRPRPEARRRRRGGADQAVGVTRWRGGRSRGRVR